jgi:hypothetical protein
MARLDPAAFCGLDVGNDRMCDPRKPVAISYDESRKGAAHYGRVILTILTKYGGSSSAPRDITSCDLEVFWKSSIEYKDGVNCTLSSYRIQRPRRSCN